MALFTFGKRKIEEPTPEGVCPNCWGHQKYGGKVVEAMLDKQIDINNHKEKHAFIQDFVVNHLDGIRLKKDKDREYEVCNTCSTRYKLK